MYKDLDLLNNLINRYTIIDFYFGWFIPDRIFMSRMMPVIPQGFQKIDENWPPLVIDLCVLLSVWNSFLICKFIEKFY